MHHAAVWQHSSTPSIETHLAVVRGLPTKKFQPKCVSKKSSSERRHLISWSEHLNTSGITSHGTDSFRVTLITPGHPIPKISTRLTIFWGSTWKTKFVKTTHRQERTSSENKSDEFHKKCLIELWTILMFEMLLCCYAAARCMERTQY